MSDHLVKDGLKRLQLAGQYRQELQGKTNTELADLLIERVWSVLRTCSQEAVIVEEAADRLRKEG